jgi:hypothetical protein
MDRTKKLIETIRSLMDGEFSGNIKINFSQGSIGRVEKSEEFEDASIICARDMDDDEGVRKEKDYRNEKA